MPIIQELDWKSRSDGVRNPNMKLLSICLKQSSERSNSECLQPPVQHGGGAVIVWDCISTSG